jgi:RNA polymerase sigma factor (sigma-70 family)
MSAPHEIAYPALYAGPESSAPTVSEYDAQFIATMDQRVARHTHGEGKFTPEAEAAMLDATVQRPEIKLELTAIDAEIEQLTDQTNTQTQATRTILEAKRKDLQIAYASCDTARTTLYEGSMRFAYDLAQNISHPDRTHIAFCGLLRAIDEYDPAESGSFTSWAKGIIKRDLRNNYARYTRLQESKEEEPNPIVIPFAHVTYPNAAPEEADVTSDTPANLQALTLAELALDQATTSPEIKTTGPESKVLKDTLRALLSKKVMSDTHADVLIRHLGLFDTPEATFDQIKEQWNLSRERIRQIESEGLRKLRESDRLDRIEGFYDDAENYPYNTTVTADDALRTGRVPAVKASPKPKDTGEPYIDGSLPPRVKPQPPEGRLERGSDWYKHYYTMLKTRLSANNSARYHGDSTSTTPYPKEIFNMIEEDIGKYLTPQHIEDAWNELSRNLITTASGDNSHEVTGTRLCQLFSALLANRMTDDDHITIRIPAHFDGQWDDIGAWAKRGKITIVGEPGKNVGRHKSENAQIEVIERQYQS